MDLSILLSNVSQYLSITFILIVNITTYILIKFFENINGVKILTKAQKKLTAFGVVAGTFIVFKAFELATIDIIILSSLLSPYTYTYVMKYILKGLNVSYNETDTVL